jgi:hypothetical protein
VDRAGGTRPVLTAQDNWVNAGVDAVAHALRERATTLFTSRRAGG